ncbi:phage tail tape measure protein [Paenibacillus algorifonticola]|uniref:phage tail tape measure protein n=1 Tax=Paenibacillus algorifonticola TaxID=684063 RepID=UPI003D2B4EE5
MAGKIYDIAFELSAKLEGSYNAVMSKVLDNLGDIDKQMHAIGAMRISGDMLRPLNEGLHDLERNFREIRGNPMPNNLMGNMNAELKEASKESKSLLDNLLQISRIRMPGNMFGNDMRNYLRDVERLERSMRDLQNAGGPSGGGAGGGGGGLGGLGGGGMLMGGAAVAGGAALAAGAAGVAAGVGIFNTADAYQTAMAQIQVGTGAAQAKMAGLGDTMVNIYNKGMGENFMDIANSIAAVERVTKLSGSELESTTKNAIAYRDAFGDDIAESIRTADTMMKNFGITSDEAYSLLAQGAQGPLSKTMDLLDTANEYSAYFAQLGFSANQMFDTFAAGLEAGAFSLDKVGDGIKEFGIRTKDGSKASLDAYKSLGLNGAEMTAQFAAGGKTAQEAFLKTSQAIAAIKDPVVANAVSVQLFGTQAEDLEARVVTAMTSARSQFDMTKDTMGEVAKIKYGTIGKAFEGIGRQLQTGLLLPLSKLALPLLDQFSGWLQDVLPAAQESFKSMGKVIADVSGLVGSLFKDGFNFDFQMDAMNIMDKLGINKDAQFQIIDAVGSTFESIMSLKDGLLQAWDTIGPHVMTAVGSIGKIVKQLMPIVFSISRTFQQVSMKVIAALMPVVTYIMSRLWPILSQIFDYLATEVMPAISAAIALILPKIQSVADKIGDVFGVIIMIIKPVIDNIVMLFNIAFPIIKAVVTNAIDAIGVVIGSVMDILGGVIDFVTGVFTGNWEKAWQGVKDIFTGLFEGLGAILVFPINVAIDGINAAIRGINGMSFTVPDWVPGIGGETIGNMGIPEIPKLNGYAEGGYITQPEIAWVGEGKSNEWIIPENNSQRSRDLWQSAGTSMGLLPEGGGGGEGLNYSPTFNITINGGGGEDIEQKIQRAVAKATATFERQYDSMMAQRRRVSLR